MLVFTRKRDETIMIGDAIEIRVLRTSRDGVKLGVIAPSSVAVHRHEIYNLIRAENASAARRADEIQGLLSRLKRPSSPQR